MVEKDPFLNFISDLSEKIKISKEHKQIMERVNDPKASIDESKSSLDNLILTIKEKIESTVTNKENVPALSTTQITPLTSNIIKVVSEEENNFQDFVGKLKGILAKPREISQDKTTTSSVSSLSVSPVKSEEQEDIKKYVNVLNQPKTKKNKNTQNYVEELEKIKDGIQIEKEDTKVTEIKKLIEEYAEKYIKKAVGMMGESGGGTVAVQYANGGTMNGDLNVNGNYLSGGVNLLDVFALQPDLDNQTLYFNESNAQLSISNGNTVSLSALSGEYTDRLVSGSYQVVLSSNGAVTFPDNLTIDNSTISNLNFNSLGDGSSLSSGSQIEVGNAGTTITSGVTSTVDDIILAAGGKVTLDSNKAVMEYGVTNSLGGGGSLISQGRFAVDNDVVMEQVITNSIDENSSLIGRNQVIVNSNVLIGRRITNILDGNTTTDFSGWTFDNGVGSLTFPDNTTQTTAFTGIPDNIAYTNQDTVFEKNVTVQGNLTALGTSTFQNTVFTTTSALSVVSLGPGPALYVYQAAGPYDIASFYDGDGVEVLHVGNAQGGGNPLGQVGINTSFPSAELTVNGAISSNGVATVLGGNSNQWNSNYTTTNTNSAIWSNWSTVSASYALGSQYVKLSGDTMTGTLSVGSGGNLFSPNFATFVKNSAYPTLSSTLIDNSGYFDSQGTFASPGGFIIKGHAVDYNNSPRNLPNIGTYGLYIQNVNAFDPGTTFESDGRARVTHAMSFRAGINNFTGGSDHCHVQWQGSPSNSTQAWQMINGGNATNVYGYQFPYTNRFMVHTLPQYQYNTTITAISGFLDTREANRVTGTDGVSGVKLLVSRDVGTGNYNLLNVGEVVGLTINPGLVGLVAASYNCQVTQISANAALSSFQFTAYIGNGDNWQPAQKNIQTVSLLSRTNGGNPGVSLVTSQIGTDPSTQYVGLTGSYRGINKHMLARFTSSALLTGYKTGAPLTLWIPPLMPSSSPIGTGIISSDKITTFVQGTFPTGVRSGYFDAYVVSVNGTDLEFSIGNLMDSYSFENRSWPFSASGTAGWLLYGGSQDTVHRPTFGTTGFYFEREPWNVGSVNWLSGGMVKNVVLGTSESYGNFSYGLGWRGVVLGDKSGTFAGDYNTVFGNNSVALGGEGLISLSSTSHQAVVGKYNNPNNNALFVVGAGTNNTNRTNVLEVEASKVTVNGAISSNGTITALGGNSNQWNSNYTTTNTNSANWILDGGNTKGANLTIGSNDSYNVILKASSVPVVNITTDSNVGIGYTFGTPTVNLVGYNFFSARSTQLSSIGVYSKYTSVGAGRMYLASGLNGVSNYTLGWGISAIAPTSINIAQAIAASEYIAIPIYPLEEGDYNIIVNGVSSPFYVDRSASGPQKLAFLYSTSPALASYVQIFDITISTTATDLAPLINSVLNASNITITYPTTGYFALVPYSSISNGGQFRLPNSSSTSNDIQFTGSVDILSPVVPNERLTVIGNISSTNTVYASNLEVSDPIANGTSIAKFKNANNSYLEFLTDAYDRTAITIKSNPAATSLAGTYFTADGYEEAWFNVVARQNASGLRFMRFGNLSNTFSIQLLADNGSYIQSRPFNMANNAPSDSFCIISNGNVGLNQSNPSEKLDVNGNIKATGGNSLNWNSNYTTTSTNSGKWGSVYTSFNSNSAKYDSNYTSFNSNSALYVLSGGNTNNSSFRIGTNDAFDFSLETNNINRVDILSSGEITLNPVTITPSLSSVQNLLNARGTAVVGSDISVLTGAPALSSASPGQFSTGGMLIGQNEGGAYVGRTGVRESSWQVLPGTEGATWALNTGAGNRGWNYMAMSSDGRIQAATTLGGFEGYIYTSFDYGATWIQRAGTGPRRWVGIAISSDGRIQTAVDYSDSTGLLYTSYDYGASWTARTSISESWLGVRMSSDGKIQAAITTSFLYTSYDYGVTWVRRFTAACSDVAISSDGRIQTTVATVATTTRIYTSYDYGVTWTPRAFNAGWRCIAMSSDGRIQTAGTDGSYIYTSYDYGVTWTARIGAGTRRWLNMAMSSDGKVQTTNDFTPGYIYTSTDYGVTWIARTAYGVTALYDIAMSSDGRLQAGVQLGPMINSYATSVAPNPVTVLNSISSTDVIYASGGNSNKWNSTYTTVNAISGLIPAPIAAVSYTVAVGSTTTNSINLSTIASGAAQLVYTIPPGKTFLPYDFAVIVDTVAGGNVGDTSLPTFRIYRHNTQTTAINQVTNQLAITNPSTLITSGRYYKTGNNVLASNGKQIVNGNDAFPQNSLWFRVDSNGTNTYTQLSGRVIVYGNLI